MVERDPPPDRRAPVVTREKCRLAVVRVDQPDHVAGQFVDPIGGDPVGFLAQVVPALVGDHHAEPR
jgi:hypothetical protein